eukprot:gene22165-biopygen2711
MSAQHRGEGSSRPDIWSTRPRHWGRELASGFGVDWGRELRGRVDSCPPPSDLGSGGTGHWRGRGAGYRHFFCLGWRGRSAGMARAWRGHFLFPQGSTGIDCSAVG